MKELLLTPLSWLYGLGVFIRHKLFDLKILKSVEFNIPIVCVGNIAVGGTGKTPHTEYLISYLSRQYNVGILSRGYGRKTKGFIEATRESSYREIGDEPKQIKQKFPNIPVCVCEKRVDGIKKMRELHPEINLIILDDAFQHRYVEPWINIVLVDFNNPFYEDKLMPLGTLRDLKKQMNRAHVVIMTKVNRTLTPLDLRITKKKLALLPFQNLYYTEIVYDELMPMFWSEHQPKPKDKGKVIVMTGIARPESLYKYLESKYEIVEKIEYPDHHAYKVYDLKKLEQILSKYPNDTIVVVTEKDSVKLSNKNKISKTIQDRLYYAPIGIQFIDDRRDNFHNLLNTYVRENQKYNIISSD
jgi:tetraacyldisaccharide 4'-kinase